MNLISLTDASKDFGVKTLFNKLTLHIKEGDRIGLIGSNGSGKSTLLKVLAGNEPLLEGTRQCSPQLGIELVGQESVFQPGNTVLQEVLAGCREKKYLLLRFKELTEAVSKRPNEKNLLAELGQITQKMDIENAWGLEQQCQEILSKLGIIDLHMPVEDLSGGYRKRVDLASALVSKPDLLLLDEPTNHLDASAVEWLQSWLEHYPGALVLVTHDRYVLDQVTHRIVEIDHGKAIKYSGNYSTFLKEKATQETLDIIKEKKFQSALRKELSWLRKGPKARSTKQKARLKKIEEMRKKTLYQQKSSLKISTAGRRIGRLVIEAEKLSFTSDGTKAGKKLLDDFSYSFTPEDRVGIIGQNGSGKSTFLELIAGRRQPTKGDLRIGETVHIGYLDQHTTTLCSKKGLERKVIDYIEESANRIDLGKETITASQLLERFLFTPAQQHSPLTKISGGERRRLAICRMLIQAPNVLLLDEPTNDLDIETLRVLEEFLEDFEGCVLVVSHDRYFLDRTVDRIFSFENGKLSRYEGNYSTYLDKRRSKEHLESNYLVKNDSSDKSTNESKNNQHDFSSKEKHGSHMLGIKPKKRRRSFKESRELETLEKDLPSMETERNSLEKKLTDGGKDMVLISKKLASIVKRIDEAEERWLELSDLEA